MTQAQPLGARDIPDHQYGKALAAKWMKGMGYLGRSQSLAGLGSDGGQAVPGAARGALLPR